MWLQSASSTCSDLCPLVFRTASIYVDVILLSVWRMHAKLARCKYIQPIYISLLHSYALWFLLIELAYSMGSLCVKFQPNYWFPFNFKLSPFCSVDQDYKQVSLLQIVMADNWLIVVLYWSIHYFVHGCMFSL